MPPVIEPTLELLDRDQSILVFNERVLNWAEREDVPLLERLRYLCIVSSNLDEWFEVRCAPHVSAAKVGDEQGPYSRASFERLMTTAHGLVAKQYQLGQMIGVNGTPAIVLANGKMIPGYQPAPQLAKIALESN